MVFISTRAHGMLDCLMGLLLIGWPHVIVGGLEVGAAAMTQRRADDRVSPATRPVHS